MSNFIHNLHIENFKSIKSLDLKCKRINVFVGKPNVGKSNILEAVGLYGAGYQQILHNNDKPLKSLVRFEKYGDFFHEHISSKPIAILSDIGIVFFFYSKSDNQHGIIVIRGDEEELEDLKNSYDTYGNILHEELDGLIHDSERTNCEFYIGTTLDKTPKVFTSGAINVRKYTFNINSKFNSSYSGTLLPPYGDNLAQIIGEHPSLHQKIGEIFNDYGLEFVYVFGDNNILIQRKKGIFVSQYPFALIADTLQRFIFNLAAIKTNQNSILVLEEPEAHSFPGYIKDIAEEIVKSDTNQFFIATHSPYLLNTLLEKTTYDEMAFFVTWYEDYETKARELTEAEVEQLMDYGIDIFFNLNAYLEN